MKITIIGGGNIGTLMAAEIAYRGHEVTLYTSKPERWKKEIQIYSPEDKLLRAGVLVQITNSMREAMESAEILFVTVPAPLFQKLGEAMLPFAGKGQKIGIIPGSGGAEYAFRGLMERGCILFGFQRVHSIARLKKRGESVYELGRKAGLKLGALPAYEAAGISKTMERLLDMPCEPLEHYLSVTLTPSNSILHTVRLYAMFRDYRSGVLYPRNFLFYEEWSHASSELLIACDKELQKLCRAIPLEPGSVLSLCDYYESRTAEAMTEKIRNIPAFKGLTSPMREVEGGWIPDWESRYFTADFCFGLKVIRDIARLFAVPTPNLDLVWKWYENTAPEDHRKVFEIDRTKDLFMELYDLEIRNT